MTTLFPKAEKHTKLKLITKKKTRQSLSLSLRNTYEKKIKIRKIWYCTLNPLIQHIFHHHNTKHHKFLLAQVQQRMLCKMTPQPRTKSLPPRASFLLVVLAVVEYVIGSIFYELCVLTVGKNALINGSNVFDTGLNYGALPPNTISAAQNTASNFTNSCDGFALNKDIAFDLTALSTATAAVAPMIRIENENVFDSGPLSPHATQSPQAQTAFVFDNIDNGLRDFGVVRYVYHVTFDRIGFGWDLYDISNENFYSMASVAHLIIIWYVYFCFV